MPYTSLIAPGDLHRLIESMATVVVDCRFYLDNESKGQGQYHNSHIPGAFYAHLDNDLSSGIEPGVTGRHPLPGVSEFAAMVSGWGVQPGTQVVCYDQAGGGIAARLWWLFKWIGHDEVAVLDGGFSGWVKLGLPVDDSIPQMSTGQGYPVNLQHELVYSTDQVAELVSKHNGTLVDSRKHERFLGEEEPIDPVAGHIPGAANIPFTDNTKDGAWLEIEELDARFTEISAPYKKPVVFYCGSGVTACSNILAWFHVGKEMPILYAGSWSEWITDPARPVATGEGPPGHR